MGARSGLKWVKLVEGWGHIHFTTHGIHLGDKKGILGPYRKIEMLVWLCLPLLGCFFWSKTKGFERLKGIQECGNVRSGVKDLIHSQDQFWVKKWEFWGPLK